MLIDHDITAPMLSPGAWRVFQLAAEKTAALDRLWDVKLGTPVFTVAGKYSTRGWTEWTQGFQYGCLILAGDGLDDRGLIERGRGRTIERMLPHVTHIGVHDHGFNNLSTYGNLLRLMNEGRLEEDAWQRTVYENAIAASGAVQAARWSPTNCGLGYIYSFNGPHSLFVDTMRTTRVLGVAHQLGHWLMGENDARINLLGRSIQHGRVTSNYLVFHGDSSHGYDVRGRTAHEGTFNRNDGNFRARSTQQGYSPFSTWTRGLAWAMLGYAEELEFFKTLSPSDFKQAVGLTKREVLDEFQRGAIDTCDHYIEDVSTQDGITYWDDGAPQLHRLGDWRSKPADPFNGYEPVDASASAIAAQGLIRLGNYLGPRGGKRYLQAGLSVAKTLFDEPYLSVKKSHQGLLLHSIYHWPNRWDHVPKGQRVASGESSMWGDYHLLELALLIQRLAEQATYPAFFISR
ncbi:MAG: glycosyl hydrolase [Planctomycetota bacterium]|nr:glycosyl hydrolase [Planctomycetota bacterium]